MGELPSDQQVDSACREWVPPEDRTGPVPKAREGERVAAERDPRFQKRAEPIEEDADAPRAAILADISHLTFARLHRRAF